MPSTFAVSVHSGEVRLTGETVQMFSALDAFEVARSLVHEASRCHATGFDVQPYRCGVNATANLACLEAVDLADLLAAAACDALRVRFGPPWDDEKDGAADTMIHETHELGEAGA